MIVTTMQRNDAFWDRISTDAPAQVSGTSRKIVEAASELLHPEDRVLDFGCGNGAITNALSRHCAMITGIDTSKRMISRAMHGAMVHDVPKVNYHHADLFESRFKHEAYDAVTSFNVFHFITDHGPYFRRMYDLIKPGGTLIIATPCLMQNKNGIRWGMKLAAAMSLIPQMLCFTVLTLRSSLEKVGFTHFDTQKLSRLPEFFLVMKKPA